MGKFTSTVRKVVSFPFRALYWLLSLPFKGIKSAYKFLVYEPEDRPLADAVADTLKEPMSMLDHIQALRKHIFRILIDLHPSNHRLVVGVHRRDTKIESH
jgi:hypothetical protein